MFVKIVGELKDVGKNYLMEDQITKILRSVPPQWLSNVVAIKSMKLNNMIYDEVREDLTSFKRFT